MRASGVGSLQQNNRAGVLVYCGALYQNRALYQTRRKWRKNERQTRVEVV
jgi:hypothetical protein